MSLACGGAGDITPPIPAPPAVYREPDDWAKAGTNVILKGGVDRTPNGHTFRVFNEDNFTWTLLDDIGLFVTWDYKEITPQATFYGGPEYATLRCPAPRTIPPGGEVEIAFDACRPITVEPGHGAIVKGYRIVAKEGANYGNMEFGFPLLRTKSQQGMK